jgi:hypothetical protein
MTEDADDPLDTEREDDGDAFVFVDEATATDEHDPNGATATDEHDPNGATATEATTPVSDAETGETDRTREAPLADLAADVRERRERSPESDSDFFETVDVDEIDPETVWEELESTDRSEATVESSPSRRAPSDVDAASAEAVVPKRSYCERCPHFATPPEVACAHEGTAIVELVDADHFRVTDCPMVDDGDDGPTSPGSSDI